MSSNGMTIVDLARELKLSKTTVSAALSQTGRVSDETRGRVLALARARGYVHNRSARQLRGGSTGALGIYVPAHVRNLPFYMDFTFGVVDEVGASDYDLTLLARTSQGVQSSRAQVDGIIVVDPLPADPVVDAILDWQIPVVAAGRLLDADPERPTSIIEADHFTLASELLDSLEAAGCRRPAFLKTDESFSSAYTVDIDNAYRSWCSARNLESITQPMNVEATNEELRGALTQLLADPSIDGIMCAVQGVAGRSAMLVEQLGRSAGVDLHLGTCAGDPLTEISNPAIHAVELRARNFGHESARLLLDIVDGVEPSPSFRRHRGVLSPAALPVN